MATDIEANVQETSNIRVARIIRFSRLFRVFRVVRYMRALRTLVHSILCTLKSMVSAMLLLVLVIYIYAILFTQAVTDHLKQKYVSDLHLYWGDVPTSMFTLF